jgi:hypothetical protein
MRVLFLKISLHRMCDHYLPKLTAAIRSVDREALWLREGENLNSIGGIALHLCEHIRRNTLYLRQGAAFFSRGIEEYFPHLPLSPEELAARVEQTFGEWRQAMEVRLRQIRSESHPEEADPEDEMHRVYHLVEHTGYHLGQIVDRAKRLTGRSFGFIQGGLNERQLRERIQSALDPSLRDS